MCLHIYVYICVCIDGKMLTFADNVHTADILQAYD
jgi:hypothetical protein